MKKLILSLFVCVLSVFCSLDAQIYQPSIYDRSERKTTIGYTTNYSNGKFTSSAYDNFNGGKPKPRKVSGYTADGDYFDDGKGYGDSDSSYFWSWATTGSYYYYNGNWYLYESGDWCIWQRGGSGWAWYYRTNNPNYYNPFRPWQDPSDYEMHTKLTPLHFSVYPFFVMVIIYIIVKRLKLRRCQNEKLDLERMDCSRFSSSRNSC